MVAEFKHGKESLEVDPHSGGTLTVTTLEIVTNVENYLILSRDKAGTDHNMSML